MLQISPLLQSIILFATAPWSPPHRAHALRVLGLLVHAHTDNQNLLMQVSRRGCHPHVVVQHATCNTHHATRTMGVCSTCNTQHGRVFMHAQQRQGSLHHTPCNAMQCSAVQCALQVGMLCCAVLCCAVQAGLPQGVAALPVLLQFALAGADCDERSGAEFLFR